MSRTLAPIVQSEVSRTITRPGILVEIEFPSGVWRASSRGARTWQPPLPSSQIASTSWTEEGVTYRGAERNGEGSFNATLTVRNTDTLFGVRCLSEDARGRACRVWYAPGTTPNPATGLDVFFEFSGTITQYVVAPAAVTLSITAEQIYNSFTPRRTVARWHGYNATTARDSVILFNNERFRISRED